jgi:hypothetical protein
VAEREGVRYIAPIDGDFGGAWIGANECGVSICLLNGARRGVQTRGGGRRSRGLLLPELLTAASLMEVNERLWRADLTPYAPFTLAVLEPGQPASVAEWDGFEKVIVPYAEPYMPLVSSSFDPDGVQVRRREEFARRLESAGKLDARVLCGFHESHGRGPDAYSPCMHRADARTVSFSWIKVGCDSIEFFYAPEAPCRRPPGGNHSLELRRA